MHTYRFYKDEGGWFIDLPQYLEQGGSKGDLAMVQGADTMLDRIAGAERAVDLDLGLSPFEGADELELLRACDPVIGGGDYVLKTFEGKEVNQEMWLCSVTEYVFSYLPERIYLRRAK